MATQLIGLTTTATQSPLTSSFSSSFSTSSLRCNTISTTTTTSSTNLFFVNAWFKRRISIQINSVRTSSFVKSSSSSSSSLRVRAADTDSDASPSQVNATGGNAPAMMEEVNITSSVHYCCDGCSTVPILRQRWHCTVCPDFDLCEACYEVLDADLLPPPHSRDHPMTAFPIVLETVGGENDKSDFQK